MSSRRPSDSDLPPVVLLLGAESTLRDAALAALRDQALAGAPRDFNEDRFDFASSGTDPVAIEAAARTLPVMSSYRVVLVRGLADRRSGRFLDKVLPDYLDDPSPTTCLVLEAPKVDKRSRWVKAVVAKGQLRDLSGPRKPADVKSWIDERLRGEGKKPSRGTAAALFESVGADLDLLAGEVAKLSLYVGARDEVTPDDVAEISADLRPRALYELSDAIGQRRLAEALAVLARLLDQGEAPLRLLAALANHFRRLLRASECRPLEAREVQRTLGIHPYAAQKVLEQARDFGPRRLRRCLDAIRRTDEALKGAIPLAPRLAIERLVLAVCA